MNTETYLNKVAYWKGRAESYNNLNWVNDPGYLDMLISAGDFLDTDIVLDIGTGAGVVAEALVPLVDTVIGIDISLDMLPSQEIKNRYLIYQKCNIQVLPYLYDSFFDRVTARMVFHHIIKYTGLAMTRCYDALKPRGKMILAESVPPTNEVFDEYKKIMHLKEERLVFKASNLIDLMSESGFKDITTYPYTIKRFSVKNWLVNNNLSQEIQDKLFQLHTEASDAFKQACNMVITEDDCLIDSNHLILVGKK